MTWLESLELPVPLRWALIGAIAGGVLGGAQSVWSVGLNWYPTSGLRFMLDYSRLQVNHIEAPGNDISANAIGLRSQIAL